MGLTVDLSPGYSTTPLSPVIYIRLSALTGDPADSVLLQFKSNYTPSDPHTYLWQNTVFTRTFNGSGKHPLGGQIQNRLCSYDTMSITSQQVLPAGWTGKFCVASTACSMNDTTIKYSFASTGDPLGYDSRTINYTITVPTTQKTVDSAILYVSVHPKGGTVADSGNYRFSLVVNPPPQGVEADPSAPRAGVVVVNAWPNPIMAASKLNLDIMTDRDGPAIAHIYDMSGIEKATLEVGEIAVGSNRVTLSGLAVPSGDYILRIQQDGANSGPVRISYIR